MVEIDMTVTHQFCNFPKNKFDGYLRRSLRSFPILKYHKSNTKASRPVGHMMYKYALSGAAHVLLLLLLNFFVHFQPRISN
jgi:hypothetical protein